MEIIKKYESFQQDVIKIKLDNGTIAIRKKIISDYSWWNYDKCDVYAREKNSYSLLSGEINTFNLIKYLDAKKTLLIQWCENDRFDSKIFSKSIGSIIDKLKKMRSITCGDLLDTFTFDTFISHFVEMGFKCRINEKLIFEIINMLKSWKSDMMPNGYLHGDLHIGNMLQKNCNILGFIDFEEALSGPPAFDAANLGLSVHYEFGKKVYDEFKQQYEKEIGEKLISSQDWSRFCFIRNWIASEYLRKFCSSEIFKSAEGFLMKTASPEHGPSMSI